MATVEELVRSIKGSLPLKDLGGPVVAKWIDERYKEMVSKVRFKHLRKLGELQLPAYVEDGTITTTRDSTAVSGSSTSWLTSPSITPYEFWFLRGKTAWYNIASVTDGTNLVLTTAWSEGAVSGGSYKIVKRYHPLASDARWLGSFVHSRTRLGLDIETPETLDIIAPGRIHVGGYPRYVALMGKDATNSYLMIEVYPPPKDSEIIHYIYWTLPSALSMGTTIPPQIDDHMLKEGAMVDVYKWAKIVSIEKGNVEAAGFYGNWEERQRTVWKLSIKDAQRTDRGVDDTTLLLQLRKGSSRRGDGYGVRTARGDIVAGWTGLG